MLEIDTKPLIIDRIQEKVLPIKKFLKENDLNYSNFLINNDSLTFTIDNPEKLELFFFNKTKNIINPYIAQYNSHELDLIIKKKI